ncbi:hypothetical protein BJF78_06950 [Pseudonocardia sp. CNS-139]|nr:hypothetical protein BJF78_06950 [Pseudonocardia sp. CNS-139]
MDGRVHELDGDILDDPAETGRAFALADIELLVPLDPDRVGKVVGVASNYNDPAAPRGPAPHPRWFAKQASALAVHDATVELPRHAGNLNHEGELVVIVGRGGRRIPLARAADHILGVTVGNDWSENTWYVEVNGEDDPSRVVSKAVDGWAVLHPVVHRGLDFADLGIEIRVNGDVVAFGRTSQMVNDPLYLIHYLSYYVTLAPGDVIFTGTVAPPVQPGHHRDVFDGDVVEVEIENIGVLRNRVVLASTAGATHLPVRHTRAP